MVIVPRLAVDWSRPSGEKLNVVLVRSYPEPTVTETVVSFSARAGASSASGNMNWPPTGGAAHGALVAGACQVRSGDVSSQRRHSGRSSGNQRSAKSRGRMLVSAKSQDFLRADFPAHDWP